MILIADCGGTKSDYAIIQDQHTKFYSGLGFNFTTDVKIELPSEILLLQNEITEAYLYIAGYNVKNHRGINLLPTTIKTNLYGDMLGACRAAAGNDAGIVCILGTGSNAAFYNNGELVDKIPSLGYILDNEGGGSHIGGLILKNYFSRMMPTELRKQFANKYKIDHANILNALYKHENVARTLATYTRFLTEIEDYEWKRKILFESFESFFRYKVYPLNNWNEFPFYFCGGIANAFSEELTAFLKFKNININKIIDRPISGLVEYHKSNK